MRYFSMLLMVFALLLQGCAAPVVAAGVSDGLVAVKDRRSADAVIEDEAMESKSAKRIEEKYKEGAHVSVSTFNRFALLTGDVSSESMRMDIERIVGSVPNVKGIANEIVVRESAASVASIDDAAIASSVKTRFAESTAFKADHVKVITETGVVFLMGLVTHAEADAASEIASTTRGVQKVVRVFEYTD